MTRARLPCSLHFPDQSLRTKVSIIQHIFFSRSHEFTNRSEGLDDVQKSANISLSCRLLERAPRASITRHTAVTIRISHTRAPICHSCNCERGGIAGTAPAAKYNKSIMSVRTTNELRGCLPLDVDLHKRARSTRRSSRTGGGEGLG